MTHEHDSHAGKCDCGCDEHRSSNKIIYVPVDTGSTSGSFLADLIMAILWLGGILFVCLIVMDIGVGSVVEMLCLLFVALVIVVTIVCWIVSLIEK